MSASTSRLVLPCCWGVSSRLPRWQTCSPAELFRLSATFKKSALDQRRRTYQQINSQTYLALLVCPGDQSDDLHQTVGAVSFLHLPLTASCVLFQWRQVTRREIEPSATVDNGKTPKCGRRVCGGHCEELGQVVNDKRFPHPGFRKKSRLT
jgi:hypothetical protein